MREAELAYVIRDRYPVTAGHLLIIPKRHEPSWFELSQGLRPLSPVQREWTFPREFPTHVSSIGAIRIGDAGAECLRKFGEELTLYACCRWAKA